MRQLPERVIRSPHRAGEEGRRDLERPRGSQVDDELEFGRLLDAKFSGALPSEGLSPQRSRSAQAASRTYAAAVVRQFEICRLDAGIALRLPLLYAQRKAEESPYGCKCPIHR